MCDVKLSEIHRGAMYLSVNGIAPYKEIYVNDDSMLEIPKNSCYMMSAYETEYPYAKKFLSIVRDINGRYHLFDYNIFVLEKSGPELTNYIYQDTVPLISVKEWIEVIQQHHRKNQHTPRYDLTDSLFQTNLSFKMSYNQAFMMYRLLEIAPDDVYSKFMNNIETTLVEFIQDRANLTPREPSKWNWKKWNQIGMPDFASFQRQLIRNGISQNLANIEIVLNTFKIMVGRIDARYAGIISINFCYPEKYQNFERDLQRFDGYIALAQQETPHLFDVRRPFIIEPSSFSSNFFNSGADSFVSYLFEECKGMKTNVCLIGANKNGCNYSQLLK
jgi:hypothetical protein